VPPSGYGEHRFDLELTWDGLDEEDILWLSIYSSGLEEAISCVDLLAGLHDPYCGHVQLRYAGATTEDQSRLCPLNAKSLKNMPRNGH
jgi:hypothetical protein